MTWSKNLHYPLPGAAVARALSTNSAMAGGFLNGNDLYRYCISSNPFEDGACFGYVEGVMDARVREPESAVLRGAAPGTCWVIPHDVTAEQTRDVVIRFLGDHPAIRNYAAASLIAAALDAAWPCPASTP